MSPITIRIAGASIQYDHETKPTAPAPTAMVVPSSTYEGPYNIFDDGVEKHTANLGFGYISASDLPVGQKFLILYSCSCGLDTAGVSAVVRAYQGNNGVGQTYGRIRTQSHTHTAAVPAHMRGSHLGGFCIIDASTGDPFQFGLTSQTPDGVTASFGGMSLTAVPLGSLVQGADYFEFLPLPSIDENPDHTPYSQAGSVGTFFTVLSGTFTVPTTGSYLVLACMTGKSGSSGITVPARLQENRNGAFSDEWEEKLRMSNSSNQRLSFEWMMVRQYAAGESIDLVLRGEQHNTGSPNVRQYYQPRMFVLRLDSFHSWAYDSSLLAAQPVTETYATHKTIASVAFTPYQDEHVLVLGSALLYRTNQGSQMARIVDQFDGSKVHEFCAHGNLGGIDADRNSVFCFGSPLVSTDHTFTFEVTGEPEISPGPLWSTPTLLAIGLSKATITPGVVNLDINDAPPFGMDGSDDGQTQMSQTGVGVIQNLDIFDAAPSAGSVDDQEMTVIPAAPYTIPVAHPRMWLDPARKAYLRSRVGNTEWNYWQANTSSAMQNSWHLVLKWQMTQNAADLTAAINRYFGSGGVLDRSLSTLIYDVEFRNYMRALCLAYDWFYTDSGVDVLTVSQRAILKNAILCCLYGKLNPTGSGLPGALPSSAGATDNWATSNPYNNHFFGMMVGATMAGIALHYEDYSSFTWKSGNALTWTDSGASVYQFQLPYDNGGDDDVTPSDTIVMYGSIMNWVIARVEGMMLPIYDVDFAGGWTDEGTNYGRQPSVNCMLEMFGLLRSSAGNNYINRHQFFTDHGYFHIYAQPPGVGTPLAKNKVLVNLGDQPNSDKALLSDTDRLLSLLVADAVEGYPVAQYHQFWWQTFMPLDSSDASTYRMWVFLLYNHNRASIDYTTTLSPYWFASGTGLFCSLSSWNANAMTVYMSGSYRHEEKHHSDFGALQVYIGPPSADPADGWMICDATNWGHNKDNWPAHYHTTHVITTSVMPDGWPQQRFRSLPGAPPPGGTAPAVPVLSSPSDGAIDVAVPTTLSWNSSSGATSYNVQVATDSSFASIVYSTGGITGTSTSVSGLSASQVYYWRVSATNSSGTSAYSSARSFTTQAVVTPPPGGATGLNAELGMSIYGPPDNWWNIDVSSAPLDVNSAAYIAAIKSYDTSYNTTDPEDLQGRFHPDLAADPYGIPYIVVNGTQPRVPMTWNQYASESDDGAPGYPPGYPIPEEAKTQRGWIENGSPGNVSGGGDRHMLIFDRDNRILYEIYKAWWTGSHWEGSNGAVFLTSQNYRRPEGWTSSDAAGLGVLPGLIRYDEAFGTNATIDHAFRIAFRYANGHIFPASHHGTTNSTHNYAGALPFGGRIRMKASFNIASFLSTVQSSEGTTFTSAEITALTKIMNAMKKHGLLFSDTGGNCYCTGTMDSRWSAVQAAMNKTFHYLNINDFEVVQLGWNG
jgi:hypothetical protein